MHCSPTKAGICLFKPGGSTHGNSAPAATTTIPTYMCGIPNLQCSHEGNKSARGVSEIALCREEKGRGFLPPKNSEMSGKEKPFVHLPLSPLPFPFIFFVPQDLRTKALSFPTSLQEIPFFLADQKVGNEDMRQYLRSKKTGKGTQAALFYGLDDRTPLFCFIGEE